MTMKFRRILITGVAGILLLSTCRSRVYAEEVYVENSEGTFAEVADETVQGSFDESPEGTSEETFEETLDGPFDGTFEETLDRASEKTFEETSDEPSEEISVVPYKRGTVNDTTWENEWLDMRLELPEGFQFENIDEFFGNLGVADTDDSESDDSETGWEFVITNRAFPGSTAFLFTEEWDCSAEEVMDELQSVMEQEMVDELGLDVDWSEEETVELGGQSFEHCSGVSEFLGFSICQEYYIAQKDDRIVFFFILYPGDMENEVNALLEGFSAY